MIIAIDPGKHHTAWSAWDSQSPAFARMLVSCGLIREASESGLSRGESIIDTAYVLRERIGSPSTIAAVIAEEMVSYGRQRGGNEAKIANDLIDLSSRAAFVAGYLRPAKFILVAAREWKGNVPKETIARRVVASLDDIEGRAMLAGLTGVPRSLQHNVYDAVGIGLHYLRRLHHGS